MGTYALLADSLCYPKSGYLNALQTQLDRSPGFPGKESLEIFYQEMGILSLGQQEELYTRTLDLNPLTAAYVGYQIWGESYKRGEFMALMNQEMDKYAVDKSGELPDHLIPILRYLDVNPTPKSELLDVLERAIQKMSSSLKKSDPENPFMHVFAALLSVSQPYGESGLKEINKLSKSSKPTILGEAV